jgi:hypothetical protein
VREVIVTLGISKNEVTEQNMGMHGTVHAFELCAGGTCTDGIVRDGRAE